MQPTDTAALLRNIDAPNGFGALKRILATEDGINYAAFRASLRPKYGRVKIDVVLSVIYIALTLFVLIISAPYVNPIATVVLGSIAVGFFVAHNQLYLHAAAHFELDASRRMNDTLSNIFVGSISGQEITSYRRTHFLHHTLHGSVDDSENSYFNSLTLRFMLLLLSGIYVLQVIRRRSAKSNLQPQKSDRRSGPLAIGMKVCAIALHFAMVILLARISIALALAWLGGIAVFFPFFGAIRQILEHRDAAAASSVDYAQVPHGAVNRVFASSVFSRLFGAAGFHKHALHHWDSGISYTNFAEFESFLLRTPVRTAIAERSTTYRQTFFQLLRAR